MGSLHRLSLRIAAFFLRLLFRFLMPYPNPQPNEILWVPSRDPSRTIKCHIYKPKGEKIKGDIPSPVLINMHGSGFVLPLHGSDDEFCKIVARDTAYTVFDMQYRLAPEHPFPAAIHDIEDLVRYILSQPTKFDLSRLAISGFSAGGNLALATVVNDALPKDTFRTAIPIYCSTDKAQDPAARKAPDTSGGGAMPVWLSRFFNASYLPPGTDTSNPLISPCFASVDAFPENMLFVTAAQDTLCLEAEALAAKIEAAEGKKRKVVSRRMEQCKHGWDKSTKPGTVQEKAKYEAYALVVDMLRV